MHHRHPVFDKRGASSRSARVASLSLPPPTVPNNSNPATMARCCRAIVSSRPNTAASEFQKSWALFGRPILAFGLIEFEVRCP